MDEPDQLQASLDDLYKTGFKAGREAGMREAAGMLEMTNGQILLMAGELKVGELRAVNAVMSSRRRSILSAIEGAK